ncbi:mechanosensitive ion channel family protein [Bacillus testis]|uniref:mechanosensitive ion channel family protein n=1 Tax=Bacillus testis TaxID=1622072 RepID=UPI00067F22E0|nr:mechanosensitive ion channel family protein [Bacillus testis]
MDIDKNHITGNKVVDALLSNLLSEELWIGLGMVILKIMLIIVIAGLIVKFAKKIISNIFLLRAKSPLRVSERREATMLKLLKNVISYFIYFIALTMVLETLGYNVKALIAGAGVVGLAVGFGAQSLVKDVITGFFIIFEDQFSVGDYVRIGTTEGNVEEIGLRTTKIKVFTGEIHIIPNGSIMEVTNFSIHNSLAVVDIGIAYEGDLAKAERVITELLETMPGRYENLVGTPVLLGIQNLAQSEIILRITAETVPMQHFAFARELRRELKNVLDKNGIEIPFPRMVLYSRNDTHQEQAANS